MNKTRLRLIALILVCSILLTGCGLTDALSQFFESYFFYVDYEDMEYTRPDMDALQASLDQCIALSETSDSVDEVMDAVYDFYTHYDTFYTNYTLSDIHYSADLTDTDWEAEYSFCAEASPATEAALEQLFYALAHCSLREELEAEEFFGKDFFDPYEEEPAIDEQLLAMMEQEAALENQYYTLSDRFAAADYTLDGALFTEMAELLIQLVKTRQEMAAYLGYADYPSLAYEMYYSRDYTPEEATQYVLQVGTTLYDAYAVLDDSAIWDSIHEYCPEFETYRYLRKAASSMGGIISDAFAFMNAYNLYDITYSENKLNSSFETYIWNYYAPYVFVSPYLDHSDKMSFAHEFGHFAADYACDGSFAGIDIAEIHSQAMEYLALCYNEDPTLTTYKLADSLCTYMEQSAYALFEHALYGLSSSELTVENVTALYEEVCQYFGLDSSQWDSQDFVTIMHFYTNPMYIISYVVSNDLALQFYQMELDNPGSGLHLYEEVLTSQDSYLLNFAQTYGLESPFSESRLQTVAEIFQNTIY